MLYQTLLMGEKPYHIISGHISAFDEHRHTEIELHYCLSGEYFVKIDQDTYKMGAGDLAVIRSMTPHELPKTSDNCFVLVLEVGPMLLSSYFDALRKKAFKSPVWHLNIEQDAPLRNLLEETAELNRNKTDFSELQLKGNLFKICGYLLSRIAEDDAESDTGKALRSVANIEQALDIIHNRYNENIHIEEVANLCGYSKSNFCKIFKSVTGQTFHAVLNKRRIDVACNFLTETTYSIEDIADMTGFADSKSFCRVFKNITGKTAGQYRK